MTASSHHGSHHLSGKQLRYLFATGFLKSTGSGKAKHLKVVGDINKLSGPALTMARYLSGDRTAYDRSNAAVKANEQGQKDPKASRGTFIAARLATPSEIQEFGPGQSPASKLIATGKTTVVPKTYAESDYTDPITFKYPAHADSWGRNNMGQFDEEYSASDNFLTQRDLPSKSISDMERALSSYKSGGYDAINSTLRNGTTPPGQKPALIKAQVKGMATAFDTVALAVPVPVLVHRGVGDDYANTLLSKLKEGSLGVGSVISDKAYTSTSLHEAAEFGGSVSLKIVVPKGARAIFMGSGYESELLLDKNQKFEVIGVKPAATPKGKTTLHLRLLAQ